MARPTGSAPGALSTDPESETIIDNQNLGDDLARRDAAARREKYQGDSPFATGGASADPTADRRYDGERADEKEDRFRPLAMTLNPITLVLGRFGANVEYLPAPHHGIMLNPYYSSYSIEFGGGETTYQLMGAELGYHFYTGERGANGFFAGPSFVFMYSSLSSSCNQPGCSADEDASISTYGVAMDVGGQAVLANGFTIGGGGGIMYLRSSGEAEGSTGIRFAGTVPRLLFTIGYSI